MKIEVVAATPKVEETPFVVGGVYRQTDGPNVGVMWLLANVVTGFRWVRLDNGVSHDFDESREEALNTAKRNGLVYIPDAVIRIPSHGGEK